MDKRTGGPFVRSKGTRASRSLRFSVRRRGDAAAESMAAPRPRGTRLGPMEKRSGRMQSDGSSRDRSMDTGTETDADTETATSRSDRTDGTPAAPCAAPRPSYEVDARQMRAPPHPPQGGADRVAQPTGLAAISSRLVDWVVRPSPVHPEGSSTVTTGLLTEVSGSRLNIKNNITSPMTTVITTVQVDRETAVRVGQEGSAFETKPRQQGGPPMEVGAPGPWNSTMGALERALFVAIVSGKGIRGGVHVSPFTRDLDEAGLAGWRYTGTGPVPDGPRLRVPVALAIDAALRLGECRVRMAESDDPAVPGERPFIWPDWLQPYHDGFRAIRDRVRKRARCNRAADEPSSGRREETVTRTGPRGIRFERDEESADRRTDEGIPARTEVKNTGPPGEASATWAADGHAPGAHRPGLQAASDSRKAIQGTTGDTPVGHTADGVRSTTMHRTRAYGIREMTLGTTDVNAGSSVSMEERLESARLGSSDVSSGADGSEVASATVGRPAGSRPATQGLHAGPEICARVERQPDQQTNGLEQLKRSAFNDGLELLKRSASDGLELLKRSASDGLEWLPLHSPSSGGLELLPLCSPHAVAFETICKSGSAVASCGLILETGDEEKRRVTLAPDERQKRQKDLSQWNSAEAEYQECDPERSSVVPHGQECIRGEIRGEAALQEIVYSSPRSDNSGSDDTIREIDVTGSSELGDGPMELETSEAGSDYAEVSSVGTAVSAREPDRVLDLAIADREEKMDPPPGPPNRVSRAGQTLKSPFTPTAAEPGNELASPWAEYVYKGEGSKDRSDSDEESEGGSIDRVGSDVESTGGKNRPSTD